MRAALLWLGWALVLVSLAALGVSTRGPADAGYGLGALFGCLMLACALDAPK